MFTDLNCEGQYGHCFNEPSFVVVVELGPEGVGTADAVPEAVESVAVAWPVPDMVSGGAEAGWIGTGDVEPEADESVAVGSLVYYDCQRTPERIGYLSFDLELMA